MWGITTGGYKHMGTEITLANTHLHKAGVVKSDGGLLERDEITPVHSTT